LIPTNYSIEQIAFNLALLVQLETAFLSKNASIAANMPNISPLAMAPPLEPVIPGMIAEMRSHILINRITHPTFDVFSIGMLAIRNRIPTIRKSVIFPTFEPTIPGIKEATINHIATISTSQPFQLIFSPPQDSTILLTKNIEIYQKPHYFLNRGHPLTQHLDN